MPRLRREALCYIPGVAGRDSKGGSREVEEVAGALRLAARTLDLNWYPGGGGAVISAEDIAKMSGEMPRPDDPGTKLVVLIAARLIPCVQIARRVADECSEVRAINLHVCGSACESKRAGNRVSGLSREWSHSPSHRLGNDSSWR